MGLKSTPSSGGVSFQTSFSDSIRSFTARTAGAISSRGSLWDAGQDADETYELDAVADLAIWVKSSIQLLVWYTTASTQLHHHAGFTAFWFLSALVGVDETGGCFRK